RHALARAAYQHAVLQQRTFVAPTAPLRGMHNTYPSIVLRADSNEKADMVQDLYLRELKNYRPTQLKPSDADAHVQKFKIPNAPPSPEESEIAKDLKAYEAQQVEVEGQAAPGHEEEEEWDWFEEDPEWEEFYRKEAEKETVEKGH
ncbi:MAG: hypothetical protein Q9217_006991, partial [Psora testacea]